MVARPDIGLHQADMRTRCGDWSGSSPAADDSRNGSSPTPAIGAVADKSSHVILAHAFTSVAPLKIADLDPLRFSISEIGDITHVAVPPTNPLQAER